MPRHTLSSQVVARTSWLRSSHRFILYKNETDEERAERFRRMGLQGTQAAAGADVDIDAIAVELYDRLGVPYDPVTLRARPYWRMAAPPYEIYSPRHCHPIRVEDEVAYNEYLKVVCYMLDAGVNVVDKLPPHLQETYVDDE